MEPADCFDFVNPGALQRDALTNNPTPFDGVVLIKPPALRVVSDLSFSPRSRRAA